MKAEKAMLSVGLLIFRLAIIILMIVGIYRLGEFSYMFGYSIVSDSAVEAEPGRDVAVTLTNDMKTADVAELLERKGLVRDGGIFKMQLKLKKYDDQIKPGAYILNTSMTPENMMRVMSGEVLEEDEEE